MNFLLIISWRPGKSRVIDTQVMRWHRDGAHQGIQPVLIGVQVFVPVRIAIQIDLCLGEFVGITGMGDRSIPEGHIFG